MAGQKTIWYEFNPFTRERQALGVLECGPLPVLNMTKQDCTGPKDHHWCFHHLRDRMSVKDFDGDFSQARLNKVFGPSVYFE